MFDLLYRPGDSDRMPIMDAARDGSLVSVPCGRFQGGRWLESFQDVVTQEVSLILNWPGVPEKTLWAFPQGLDDLALGHASLEFCRDGEIPVLVRQEGQVFWLTPTADKRPQVSLKEGPQLHPPGLLKAMTEFIGQAGRWDSTGCFHRAAIFDFDQQTFVHWNEDIGRHNCIDRLAGWALTQGLRLNGHALFVSARVTASLMVKASKAGFPIIVSRSAVTTASLERARNEQSTLIGFARDGRFTVFQDILGRVAL